MKTETKNTIRDIAFDLGDTASNLSTASKLAGMELTEVDTENPDYNRIETLLYAVMDLIDLHAENIKYWSDDLKEITGG